MNDDRTRGLELSAGFYFEAVRPILQAQFPRVAHAAALIGTGSEVLGYDDVRSADHHWGPRVQLFLADDDCARHAAAITDALARGLPTTFRGYSTNFGPPSDASGSRLLQPVAEGPVAHRVELFSVRGFFVAQIGLDPRDGLAVRDWLLLPQQRLLELTAGAVFADPVGELGRIRASLRYYPHDVWLYLLATQWRRIEQEEAFVGRCSEAGDELGSAVVAARLVRDLMRLCFLIERRYAPYSKWLGTAFARLACGPRLVSVLQRALAAATWQEREQALSTAYENVATLHNALGVTPPLEARVSPFYGRPFMVIHGDRFAAALTAAIRDPEVRALPFGVGGVDQFADNVDVLTRPWLFGTLRGIWDAAPE